MSGSDTKIEMYAKTGSYAPASWLAVLENDDQEALRISYRYEQLRVVRGHTPLRGSDDSKKLISREVETEQHESTLKDDKMIEILEDNGFSFDDAKRVNRSNDKIREVRDRMDGHLQDIDPKN